ENLTVEMDYKNYSLKQQFKLADRVNPRYILIIGEEERTSGIFTIKHTQKNTQEKIKKENIVTYISDKNNENS
ncbi:MAG: His/Gly/Thr/Pro-type tRNA ligase C-terminal domain-containing protein, partial [Bacilli bacterium]